MKIDFLHPELRPKEKLAKFGVESLNAIELLAIIVNSGTKKFNALEISSNLLTKYGTINNIGKQSVSELCTNYGIGTQKAISIIAALNVSKFEIKSEVLDSFDKVKSICSSEFVNNDYEKILVLFLSNGLELLHSKLITQLDDKKVNVDKNMILNIALKCSSTKLIFIHNHPNNVLRFSAQDKKSIVKLTRFFKLYNISVIDNVLYTQHGYANFCTKL